MKGYIEVTILYRKKLVRQLVRICDIGYVRERVSGNARIGISYTQPGVFKVFDLKKPSELWTETPYEEVVKQIEENAEEQWDDEFTAGF